MMHKDIWNSSLSLASMCFVIARNSESINADNAFLCGLLHEVGKLYILTRARDFPALLGDNESLESIMMQWSPTVGKSIVEAWGFPDEISATVNLDGGQGNSPTGAVVPPVEVSSGAMPTTLRPPPIRVDPSSPTMSATT